MLLVPALMDFSASASCIFHELPDSLDREDYAFCVLPNEDSTPQGDNRLGCRLARYFTFAKNFKTAS
ncbi:hypothetical protein FHX16_005645 [Rhizobium sp. BK661]|nr:hypothetical protein [Rhizobium sp. BK661]